MKKLILAVMLLLGMLSFGAKISTTGKSWRKIQQEYKFNEASLLFFQWIDDDGTYNFRITVSDFKNDSSVYLTAFYEKKPNNRLPLITGYDDAYKTKGFNIKRNWDDYSEFFMAYYKIYNSNVKGVYYINNYVDLNGKLHSRLYFGFDEKLEQIVVTDKNGNIIKPLDFVMAG